MHVERIVPDVTLWTSCLEKALHFFKVCLLPEVLGRWYSRPQIGTKDNEGTSSASLEVEHSNRSEHCSQVAVYCYCNGPEYGDMIACDNPDCKIEWFHLDCLKIKSVPKGKWYCPSCRILPGLKKRKKLN